MTAAERVARRNSPQQRERRIRARATRQRILVWAGPTSVLIWGVGMLGFAGFIPPSHANDTAAQVYHLYASNTFDIRLGMVLGVFGSAFIVPFAAVIANHMRRIEGRYGLLALTQLCSAALLSLEFIMPYVVWQAAAYRFNVEGLKITHTLHDLGWLLFVSVVSSLLVQTATIAWAILTDDSESPVLPRWVGWVNAWVTVLLVPAGIVPFFKSGPFTWAGLISFFVPLTAFCIWTVTMFVTLRTAIDEEEAEELAELELATTDDARGVGSAEAMLSP
jgi:hypothetical protein